MSTHDARFSANLEELARRLKTLSTVSMQHSRYIESLCTPAALGTLTAQDGENIQHTVRKVEERMLEVEDVMKEIDGDVRQRRAPAPPKPTKAQRIDALVVDSDLRDEKKAHAGLQGWKP